MKNQKQPFTCVKKTAAEFFLKIHWKTAEQESHYNKISYLKPAILLKRDSNTDFLQCHFRNFSGQLLLITFQGDYFWFHASSRITMLSLIKISKLNETAVI